MVNQVKKIKLLRLYSDNNIFNPVKFNEGLNIILGEKSDSKTVSGSKTNGVGKTILIQFIDFCLLSDYSRSRVKKIPINILPMEENINLELMIGSNYYTISRNRKNEKTPIINVNGIKNIFPDLEQTKKYLSNIIFEYANLEYSPSLRSLLSIIIRDENSEFKDISKPHDLRIRIPEDYTTHLYLLNFSLERYKKAIDNLIEIKSINKIIREEKKEITGGNQKDISYVKAQLNEVNKDIEIIDKALDEYKTADGFDILEQEISNLELDIKIISSKISFLSFELKKINELPKMELISSNEIEVLYNSFIEKLGTLIVKNLNQITEFKNRVEIFQRSLLEDKRNEIQKEIKKLQESKKEIDEKYSEKMQLLDKKGVFQNLRTTLSLYEEKKSSISKTQALVDNYEKHISNKKKLEEDKLRISNNLDEYLKENKEIINSFEQTFLSIHEFIMGNSECSFSINTNNKSTTNPIGINLRISYDGSHGVDRMKVFIYDASLLFNQFTKIRHPKFLIHDNLFETDYNSRIMSLNYIYNKTIEYGDEFQYIVTLNKDYLIEDEKSSAKLDFDYETYVIAKYTKENKFLKKSYKEISE